MRQSMLPCGDLHEEHLCYIVSQGFCVAGDREYEALTNQPRFRCSHCGRQANCDRNLCVPVRIASLGVTDL